MVFSSHMFALNRVLISSGSGPKMCSFTEAKCFFRSQILLAQDYAASSQVRRRSTGKTAIRSFNLSGGVRMPVLGFGTWQAKDEELERAIELALEAGYRHIDTAHVYENEKVIGRVLGRWITSGKLNRKDLFIVTKVPPGGNRPEGIRKYLKRSLENLQLDYLDLYLVHVPFGFRDVEGDLHPMTPEGLIDIDPDTDHLAIWKTMEEQVDGGLVKTIGLSNFNAKQIGRIMENARIKPANLQVELHAYFQQKELVDFCNANGIVVTAYSPLGSPGLGKFMAQFGKKIEMPDILGNGVVKEIAAKHKKTEAQVLLRHILQRGIAAIPKSTNGERIRQNIDVFDFSLDKGDVEKLNGLDQGPAARILNFKNAFPGIERHPEFPM